MDVIHTYNMCAFVIFRTYPDELLCYLGVLILYIYVLQYDPLLPSVRPSLLLKAFFLPSSFPFYSFQPIFFLLVFAPYYSTHQVQTTTKLGLILETLLQ